MLVNSTTVGDWRKRLGARLIVERVQKKKWNYAEAAEKAQIDPGTIHRIEDGENYEVMKLERYAEALGRPLEGYLREIIAAPVKGRRQHDVRKKGKADAPIKNEEQAG